MKSTIMNYNNLTENRINKNCLIYCRVSTPKQAIQGDSLEDQEVVGRRIAETKGFNVIKVFREQYTGRKNNRPVMDEIFEYLKANPKTIDVLIFRAIDRFTREGTVGYDELKQKLIGFDVQLIDGHGIIQPIKNTLEHLGVKFKWSMTSPSETAELVMAQQSKNEVTQILTRMIGAQIGLVRDGYHVGKPTDGYINQKIFVFDRKKPIQIPDPNRSHFFVKMFELRASGNYSDKEIVQQINAMGYKSQKQNKWSKARDKVIGSKGCLKLTVKQLQKIIFNPIYCGVSTMRWLENPIKTKYKGLVSIPLFNTANKGKIFIEEHKNGEITIHHDYNVLNKKRMRDNPLFPFKSVILCPVCRKPFMGSVSKGKSGRGFPTYHCSRKHKQYGVNKMEFERNICQYIVSLKSEKQFMKEFEQALIENYKETEKKLFKFSAEASNNISNLEVMKTQKIEAYSNTNSEVIRTELEKQIESIQQQIIETQRQRNNHQIKEKDLHTFMKYAKELMEHPEIAFKQKDLTILRAIFGLIFDEIPTYEEIANGTPKLSLAYRLSEDFKTTKSLCAWTRRFKLDTLEMTIHKWNMIFEGFNILDYPPDGG